MISTYMIVKHTHCTVICATPSNPAVQAKPLIARQHSIDVRLGGSTIILANAEVAEVVPKSTKYGLNPNDVPREMMRKCCGR